MKIPSKTRNHLIALAAFILGFASGTTVAQDQGVSYLQEVDGVAQSSKVLHQPCGGPNAITCTGGMRCIDDPTDKCDPAKDGMSCPGLCAAGTSVSKAKQPCGGSGGITCPRGMTCVDDTADDCDPVKDGTHCIGMCAGKP
jgi:hypothetical protein